MLKWNWNKKIGVAKYQSNNEIIDISIYQGNALAIFIYEFDDKYQILNFFVDKEHLKNCKKEKLLNEIFNNFISFEFLDVKSKDIWNLIMELSLIGKPITINLPFQK